jgi:imidazolonepropionase-like amidohydrolase
MRLTLTVCLLLSASAARADEPSKPVVFSDVTVIDVESGRLLPNRSVLVVGAKITAVAPTKDFKAPDGSIIVPAAGKYLIPGMWDMHVHIESPMPWLLDLYLANGVTGVRDMNSESFLLDWRDDIRSGKQLGPRILVSGKYLDASRSDQPPTRPTANTPEQGRELVRQRKKQRIDFIKVYSGLQPDVYRAIMDEAKLQGLPVAGHCPEMVSARDASTLGQRSIEHVTGIALTTSRLEDALRKDLRDAFPDPKAGYDWEVMHKVTASAMETPDEKKQAELFALLKKNRTWQVPTLLVQKPSPPPKEKEGPDPRLKYMHPALTQLWDRIRADPKYQAVRKGQFKYAKSVVRAMHRAGVPILAGTDCGSFLSVNLYPGFSLADELEMLVDCGLKADDALRTATLNPALYLSEERTFGTIAVGKSADLVLLDADPLADIGNVRKIAGVTTHGKWLSRSDLDKMLTDVVKAASK